MYKNDVLEAIKCEQNAIEKLQETLDHTIDDIVRCIDECTGKVVFMGIGKSGHIAEKLAATYASLGIPSFFVHVSEAVHGDLGMIEKEDIVILLSNSGNTMEVINTIPYIHNITNNTIAFTSNPNSTMAKLCKYTLLYPKVQEADINQLAPTCSTTQALVLGDSIACAIAKKRTFTKQNFHKFHPGGSLGKLLEREQ